MSASAQPSDAPVVADTVVVNYFLAVGEVHLLAELCNGTINVPRSVFDPDESDAAPDEVLSELRRGWHLHRRRAADPDASEPGATRSRNALPHFDQLPDLSSGPLRAVDLTEEELITFSRLRDGQQAPSFGLVMPLGPGEAAVLSVAATRGWRFATDDQDAIRVAEQLMPGARALRIRSLLRASVNAGIVNIARARAIHAAMKSAGFWDTGRL